MQDVQARRRLCAPFTIARTDCRLTFHRRLLTLWAWLILCPNSRPLPHNSQTLAICVNSSRMNPLAAIIGQMRPGVLFWQAKAYENQRNVTSRVRSGDGEYPQNSGLRPRGQVRLETAH